MACQSTGDQYTLFLTAGEVGALDRQVSIQTAALFYKLGSLCYFHGLIQDF